MMAFLSGGIEYAPESGRAWRNRLRAWIEETLNHRVYDPGVEARRVLGEEAWTNLATEKLNDLDSFRKVVRRLISHDMDVVSNRADYVICFWDEAAARDGAAAAVVTAASRKGIPVYVVTETPIEQMGDWVVGCTSKILPNVEELKSFLTSTYVTEARQRELWGVR